MKKIIFALIIIITLPNYLIAQNKIKYSDLKYRDNDYETGYYNGKPFNGIVVGNLAIGSLMETNYVNGKPDGLRRDFHSNGNLMLEEYIKSTVGFMKRGGPKYPEFNIGIKKEYSNNGELVLLEEYLSDGKLKNRTKFIYSESFVDFTTGKRTPLPISKTTYISNGIYEIKEFYESNGKLKEIYKINTSVKNNYGGSSKFGIYKTYFENGKIQQEGNITLNYTKSIYNNDLLIGVWKFYYENGQLESTGMYSINKWTNTSHKDKEWKFFYENGVLKEKGNYKAEEIDKDFKVGKWQEFYENGKLKTNKNYLNNKLEGDYTEYNENGIVIKKEKYWDGRVMEINTEKTENTNLVNTELNDISVLSKEETKILINEKLKTIKLKEVGPKTIFKEKSLSGGGKIFYNLKLDAEEDTHILLFYTKNATLAFKAYISNFEYSFANKDFFFTINRWEYDSKDNCKSVFYKIILKLVEGKLVFIAKKTAEYNICAG